MREVMKKAVAFAAAGTLACTAFLSAPDVQAQENSSEETKAVTQFMDCFLPMPIVEGLTEDCWGADLVGARDQGNGLWWQVEGMPNTNVEDPVIWYSDGLYHIVANKWDAKEAYYLTSEDGVTDWVRHSGIAYTPKENFLTYEDGTENNWTKLERPNVYIEDGTIKAVTFAVIDVEKEQDFGNDSHGSKIIVVPFDGEALKEFAKTDVYVDPMAAREGVAPTDDTTAQSWGDENIKNWGGEYFLQVQRNTSQGLFGEGERPDSGYDCKIAYIKYDISEYAGKDVESAYLSLVYQGLQAGNHGENRIEAALAESDWEEGIGKESDLGGNGNVQEDPEDVIWANQPSILYAESGIQDTVTALSDPFQTQTAPVEIRIDVTELVRMYMEEYPDQTEITFALSEMNGNRLHIGSKEGGDTAVPRLDVDIRETQEPEETVSKKTLEFFLNSAKEHLAAGDADSCVQADKDFRRGRRNGPVLVYRRVCGAVQDGVCRCTGSIRGQ